MNWPTKKGNRTAAAEPTPAPPPMPTFTSGQWQQRVTDLEAQAEQARQALEEKSAARSDAAGRVIVFGQADDSLNQLIEQVKELDGVVANLDSAVRLAKAEFQRAEEAEARAQRAELAAKRDAIAAQILRHSRLADEAMASVAENVLLLPELFREYNLCGGGMQPRINVSFTRALQGAGLKKYLVTDFVGLGIHALPLEVQFKSIGKPGGELPAQETPETLSA